MTSSDHLLAALAAYAAEHLCSRAIPRLAVQCSPMPTPPAPVLFEPVFYVVLQGAKRLTVNGRTLDVVASTCAASAIGLPFVSQITQATPDRPYLGVRLKLDPGLLTELSLNMPSDDERDGPIFATARSDATVLEPLGRLLRLTAEPAAVPVLAPGCERELCFRLLQGPMSGTVRRVGQGHSRFGQIRAAAEWITTHAHEPMSIPQLAASVGMSATSLHRHFKAVTGTSPLAYQRYLRLLNARRLMAESGCGVTETAFAVGYASAPQFSREYKRLFGTSPVREAAPFRPSATRSDRAVRTGNPGKHRGTATA